MLNTNNPLKNNQQKKQRKNYIQSSLTKSTENDKKQTKHKEQE